MRIRGASAFILPLILHHLPSNRARGLHVPPWDQMEPSKSQENKRGARFLGLTFHRMTRSNPRNARGRGVGDQRKPPLATEFEDGTK